MFEEEILENMIHGRESLKIRDYLKRNIAFVVSILNQYLSSHLSPKSIAFLVTITGIFSFT